MSSPDSGGDKTNQIIKQNTFPIDLAPKIALVKPNDGKGPTVQTHQFRTLAQQPMRVVMPAGSVQTAGTAQIIQTHLMPQAMIKQVDSLGRAQITALPSSRTMAQTSITVTRPLTPNTFMPRGATTVTNIGGPRGAIRAQTPPISTVTNITSGFVRGAIPPRTPSPAGTAVIPPGTTWMAGMSGSQPVQLIRANIGHSPRTRIVSQSIPSATATSSNAGITTISANIVSSQSGTVPSQQQQQNSNTIQTVSTGQPGGAGPIGQSQTFVATLATVLPPRQQTATLVYSNVNSPQQFGNPTGQRLAVTNPISGQRQVRPIQISNARLPTAGLGVRVSTANISIRGPNIPVLAPSNVLTSLPAGTSTTVSASNLTGVAGLPAARIIQVQQPQSGATAQVLGTGRITGNLMTLHPLVMNAGVSNSNVRGTVTTAKVQPSLTITHVGKIQNPTTSQGNVQLTTTNLGQGANITASLASASQSLVQSQAQSQVQQHTPTSTPVGIVMGTNQSQSGGPHQQHQLAQIVNLDQQNVNIGHSHQIQIIGSQGIQQGSTSSVVPLTITSRASNVIPSTVTTQVVRGNLNMVTTIAGSNTCSTATTVVPIAKVLPQQQSQQSSQLGDGSTVSSVTAVTRTQNVFIHSRSPSNPPLSTSTINIAGTQGSGPPVGSFSGPYYYETTSTGGHTISSTNVGVPVSTVLQSISTHPVTVTTTTNTTAISGMAYAPQAGSFAVVPSSNRNISQIHLPTTAVSSNQSIPIRFNPQLIVDGNNQGAILSMPQPSQPQPQPLQQQQQVQPGHMLIPVSNVPKPPTSSPRTPTIMTNLPRKRDSGETFNVISKANKSAVKNLAPTLMSMSSEPPPRSLTPISRPGSTDGSTTVSATSSPGIDQQEQEELDAMLELQQRHRRGSIDDSQFKSIDFTAQKQYSQPHHPQYHPMQSSSQLAGSASSSLPPHVIYQTTTVGSTNSNGNDELTPRKRARKQQLVDSSSITSIEKAYGGSTTISIQHSTQPAYSSGVIDTDTSMHSFSGGLLDEVKLVTSTLESQMKSNQSKPVEIFIKKPRTGSLLDSYKVSYKAASNHFQRYTDVKPREERRPTVMDLANQAHVLQRVNGWKIYHLTSQMEDLVELESQVYDKLSSMLQCMEAHNQNTDVDRVNDLIKGNMQRSKIVTDSINEARTQILKVFDHKSHVSDIIHRCASKRNFKKREKM